MGCSVLSGQAARAFLLTLAGNSVVRDGLTMESQGVIAGVDELRGTHPIRERIEGGGPGTFAFHFTRTPVVSPWTVSFSVHGYLVP